MHVKNTIIYIFLYTFADAVFLEHLQDDLCGGVPHREQEGLVGHVLAQRLTVDFQGPARVRAPVLTNQNRYR
jgi:hypothetical protein